MKHRCAMLLICATLLICGVSGDAQQQNFPSSIVIFPGVPTGTCTAAGLAVNSANGNLYTCFNGSWAISSGLGVGAQSFGAKGDTKLVLDVSVTASSPIITSASANFSQADVGKQADVTNTPNGQIVASTIVSVQSATQATLANNSSFTQTNVQLVWGTDDTTALLAWVAAVNGSAATTQSGIAHIGYLPAGTYYLKQSLNFLKVPNVGGFPGGWQPGIRVFGDGATSSQIQMAPPSKFTFTAASNYSAVQFAGGWQFNRVFGFSIQGNAIAGNVLYNAGGPPNMLTFSNGGHTIARDLWMFNFFGASGNMTGLNIQSDLESTYEDIADESGDVNLTMAGVITKVTFRNVYFESANTQTFKLTGTVEELSFIDCDFLSGSNTGAAVELNTTATTGYVSFHASRFKESAAPATGAILADPTGASTFNFYDCTVNLGSGAANLTGVLVQANATVNFTGGSILGTGTGKAVNQTGGSFNPIGTSITGSITGTAAFALGGGSTATTVGAAGGASALPATPTGYVIININGVNQKIPFYAP